MRSPVGHTGWGGTHPAGHHHAARLQPQKATSCLLAAVSGDQVQPLGLGSDRPVTYRGGLGQSEGKRAGGGE